MYDLNVKYRVGKERETEAMLKRLYILGWENAALCTQVVGKVGKSTPHIKPPPLESFGIKSVEPKFQKVRHLSEICFRSGDVSSSGSKLRLLSRIHVTIDDVNDAQSLTSHNETLQRFDIVSVCPGNAQVFTALCRTADIDIISLDFTHKVSFPFNKKIIDEAVERGIVFEILYAPIVASTSSSSVRREVYAGTRVLLQYLRGHSVLLSSGTDAYLNARGPLDVCAVAESLGLTREQALRSISETPARLVKRAAERKARARGPQALSVSEVLRRFPEAARRLRPSSVANVAPVTDAPRIDSDVKVKEAESRNMCETDDGDDENGRGEEGSGDDDVSEDNNDDGDDDEGFLQFSSSSSSRFKEVDEMTEAQDRNVDRDKNGNDDEDEMNYEARESIPPTKKLKSFEQNPSGQSNSNKGNISNHSFKAKEGGMHQKAHGKSGHFASLYNHKFDSRKK